MDSRIPRVSPSATSSPTEATTFHTLATISARISSAIGETLLHHANGQRHQTMDRFRATRGPPDRPTTIGRGIRYEQESNHGEEVTQEEGTQEERRQPRQAPQQLRHTKRPGVFAGPFALSVSYGRYSRVSTWTSSWSSLMRRRSRSSRGAVSSPQQRATSAFTSCSMPNSRRHVVHSSRCF